MPDPSFAARISQWLVEWRWPLLALGIVMTVAAWRPAQRLEFDRAIENMFSPDDPLLPSFRLLKRTFGGDEVVLAAYVDPQLLTAEGLVRQMQLTEAMGRVDGVKGVLSLANLPPEFFGDLTRTDSRALDVFEGYLIGADRQTTAVVCLLAPRAEATARGETIARMREIITRHDPTGVLAGEPVMVVDGFDYVQEDGRRLLHTSTLLLGIVIVVCFRSLRWMLVPVAIVQATMLWTQAVLVLGQWQLSMVSSMLAAIVTVVGVATVLHVVVRFRDQRQTGMPPREALIAAGGVVAAPVAWACLTDISGFGALMTGRVGPVRDFGFMMAIGSLLALVSVTLLLPGLALLGRFHIDPQRVWGEDRLDVGLERLMNGLLRRPRRYALLCIALAALVSCGSVWLEVESDFTRNFRQRSPIVRSYEFVESRLGGAGVWDIVLPAPAELDFAYLRRIRRLEERLRSEVLADDEHGQPQPGLTKVLSLVDALDAGKINLERLPFARATALRVALNSLEEKLPVIYSALRGEDPQQPGQHYYRVMLRARERQPSAVKLRIIEQVEQISREEFSEAQVTGFFVLLTNLIDSLLKDQWLAFAVATLGIWLMALAALRSLPLSLVAMVPNQLPIMMVMGLMGWLGVKINMGAAMIAAVSMGLSVDASIHYLMDFVRMRRQGHTLQQALHEAHQTVGRVAVFSTLALVVGFGALANSEFVPTIYFGVLIALAMLGGLLGNLVMLPLLLAVVTREKNLR